MRSHRFPLHFPARGKRYFRARMRDTRRGKLVWVYGLRQTFVPGSLGSTLVPTPHGSRLIAQRRRRNQIAKVSRRRNRACR